MKQFNFVDYTPLIWRIAKEKQVEIGIAYDMLRTDLDCKAQTNTAGIHYDFPMVCAKYHKLTAAERVAAFDEWHDFVRRCYTAVCACHGDPEKVAEVIASYRNR